jgi:DNA polymerase III subunit beta
MNFTVNSTALAQELRLINQVVMAKPTLPILMNVLLRAEEHLYLYATDLEVGFNTACRAQVDEPGSATLPAKRLLDLVEQLPDAEVQILSEGPHIRIISGAFQSRLQTLPAEDFPPPVPPTGEVTTLNTAAFQTMVKRVRYAITDKGNYAVRGAQFTVTESALGLVSTDGKRLSLTTMARNNGTPVSALLPTKTLDALAAVFNEGDLQFSQGDQHLFFVSGHRLLTSRTLVAQFPSYQRIIPHDNEHRATIRRSALMAALRRVVFVSLENQQVYLTFEPGMLQISSQSAEVGDAHEQLSVIYEGPAMRLCTSAAYLLEFLEVAVNPEIFINIKDTKAPMLLTDGADFINVVMLIRA